MYFCLGSLTTVVALARNDFLGRMKIDMRSRKRENDTWNDDLFKLDLFAFTFYKYWENDHTERTRSVCPSAMHMFKWGISIQPVDVITDESVK